MATAAVLRYLLAHGAIVVGIQHFDLHGGLGGKDAISSSDV